VPAWTPWHPVLSASEDIANARLRFANGCVANLTASRVSRSACARFACSAEDRASYISLDYRPGRVHLPHCREGEQASSLLKKLLHAKDAAIVSEFAGKRIVREPCHRPRGTAQAELQAFVECVRERQNPGGER